MTKKKDDSLSDVVDSEITKAPTRVLLATRDFNGFAAGNTYVITGSDTTLIDKGYFVEVSV